MDAAPKPDRNLAMELVRTTEYAALACARWIGRGDKEGADGAAVDAMRMILDKVLMDGVVDIGLGIGYFVALLASLGLLAAGYLRQAVYTTARKPPGVI